MIGNKFLSVAGASTPSDAQFNYVTMLLHGDGTNGAQNNTFTDSSSNNFSSNRNGNVTQGSFSPYGSNWSNYFDGANGTNLTVSAASIAFGTGDYTIEGWVNISSLTNQFALIDTRTSQTFILYVQTTGVPAFYVGSNVITGGSVSIGTWNHIALCRASGVAKLFLNGTQVGSNYSDSTNWAPTGTSYIGNWYNGTAPANGYISNLRVVIGTALYTSSFTPSTTPLTAVSGTSLLTCQSNRFVDNSASARAITPAGGVSVQRFNPFGTSTAYSTATIGGSGYFDGSGDYLQTASTLGIANSEFTICCWFYPLNTSVIGLFDSAPNVINTFRNYDVNIIEDQNTSGSVSFAGAYKANSWNWMCITKSGTSFTVYINGSSVGTGTCSSVLTESSFVVGAVNKGGDGSYYGYISDFQVLNTATVVSVPTSPITNASGKTYLLNFTNGAIYDNAMMSDLETVGNAQISTSVKKYGTGSLAFENSSGTYLSVANTPTVRLGSGDFTVEFWVYQTTVTGYQTAYSLGYTATGAILIQTSNGTGKWDVYINGTLAASDSGSSASANTWYHIAVVRSGSTVTIYRNGVSVGSGTSSADINYSAAVLTIGSASLYPLIGYMDDLRITKGLARYTANFTPPTEAFADKK